MPLPHLVPLVSPQAFRRASAVVVALLSAVIIALVCPLVIGELIVRRIDGYRLASPRLVRAAPPSGVNLQFLGKWIKPEQATPYLQALPVAAGVRREWFWLSPSPFPDTPIDSDLEKQMEENPAAPLQSVYMWNRAYLRPVICNDSARRETIFANIHRLFVFDPPDGELYPTFRFVANAHYPTGLRTNRFGWRGPALSLDKPPRTIRLAFVGASTTIAAHDEPWSYPELVGRWLNEWASSQSLDVRFEIINAGREGITSQSIAAIVEKEVLPVAPDLIVYYEGANQFWPDAFVREQVGTLPIQPFDTIHFPFDDYSALSRRLHRVGAIIRREGREPPKPSLTVVWPDDLNEMDPDLGDPRLPVKLPQILHDLDRIRGAAAAHGSELALTSFMWLVHDGLILNRVRDAMLFDYLNRSFGSFSYAHLRRYADFENRVFEKYARVNGLPFIDYASAYPRDARLFYDAVHMTTAGIRLQAWIMLQHLVPIAGERIRSRRWPHPGQSGSLDQPPRTDRPTVRPDDIRAACGSIPDGPFLDTPPGRP